MNKTLLCIVGGVLLLLAACKPGTPSKYIQPNDMENILVDYYMAKALAQNDRTPYDDRGYTEALYMEDVLRRHGVTQEELDSSLVYYFTRADRFKPIFERVSDRLDKQALELGASEGEIGKYAQYNTTGDTANVWSDRSTALLLPFPPYNRWEFQIDCDSTYRRGDELMLMFMSDYMFQTGNKSGMAYLAADYGDTVVSRNVHFSASGLTKLQMPQDSMRVMRTVKGFFYLDGGTEQTTSTRLLFLNSVQLIRFHTRDDEDIETDRIPRDHPGGRDLPDPVGDGDHGRGSDRLLPHDEGIAPDRMDVGTDSIEA